jgi:two-component system sensor histidine kinase/response regulator
VAVFYCNNIDAFKQKIIVNYSNNFHFRDMRFPKIKILILLITITSSCIAPLSLSSQKHYPEYFLQADSIQIEQLQKAASKLFMYDNKACTDKLLEALSISQKRNFLKKNIELLYSIGKVYDYMNHDNLAEDYYKEACKIALKINDDSYFSIISNNLGVLYKQQGLSKKSMMLYMQAIKSKPSNYMALINIGNIYYEWNNLSKARQYYKKAYNLLKGDSTEESIEAYIELGKATLNCSNLLEAQIYLNEGIYIAQKMKSHDKELQFKYYLSVLNDSLGNKAQAISSLQKLSNEAILKNNTQLAILALSSLSNIYNETKQLDKSIKYNIESYILADSLNLITSKKELIKKIAAYFEKQGDYKLALDYQKQLDNLNDSLFNIEKFKVTSELIFKNETSEQDKENLILQYKLSYNRQLFLYATVFLTIFFILLIIQFLLFLRIRGLNSRLKSQVEIVKRKTEELKIVNKRLNRTFSIIGHDLRAQISSIISFFDYLEVIQFRSFEPEQFKMAQSTQQDALNVLDLLENLLNWGKAQSQIISYGVNTFSIKVIVDKVEEYIKHRAEQKGVSFISEINGVVVCNGDSNMIYTVLRNLAANSLKFTPSGGVITLSARMEGSSVIFELKDTGVGMSNAVINKIFYQRESFTSHGTNNEMGSGLGLVVCIDFIEHHNSKLIVKSEIGKGTSISFSLD